MLKFIKHHMTSIENIELWPLISLVIFTLFFTVLLIWVIRRPKNYINEVSAYPLGDDELTNPVNLQKHSA